MKFTITKAIGRSLWGAASVVKTDPGGYLAASTSLLLSACLLAQPAAAADTIDDEHISLLDTISQLGIPIVTESPVCKKYPDGSLTVGAYAVDGSELVLCPDRDPEEQMTTIRHETWHVLQDLQDCSLDDFHVITGKDGTKRVWLPLVYNELKGKVLPVVRKLYHPLQWEFESEAHMASYELSAEEINDEIRYQAKACQL